MDKRAFIDLLDVAEEQQLLIIELLQYNVSGQKISEELAQKMLKSAENSQQSILRTKGMLQASLIGVKGGWS